MHVYKYVLSFSHFKESTGVITNLLGICKFKKAMTFARTGLTKHLCYLPSANRMVHTVANDELTDYCDWMNRFDSRAYPVNLSFLCTVYIYIVLL